LNFKLYFEKLGIVQKIELYLLIIMLYGVVLYFSEDIFSSFKTNSNNEKSLEILHYQNNLKSINKKISAKNNITIVNIIDKNSIKNKVFIESINVQNSRIDLKFNGNFIDVINMLKFYEMHFLIKYSKLENLGNKLYCDLKIDTKYFFNEREIQKRIKKLSNPFIAKKKKQKKKKIVQPKKIVPKPHVKPIKILAIVSSDILIDDTWYTIGDIVNNNKILKIDINSVEFLDIKKNKKYLLKVDNE